MVGLSNRSEEILAKQLGQGKAAELRAAMDAAYLVVGSGSIGARGRELVVAILGRHKGEEFCDISDTAGYPTGARIEQLLINAFGSSDGLSLLADFESAYNPGVSAVSFQIEFADTAAVLGAVGVDINSYFSVFATEDEATTENRLHVDNAGAVPFMARNWTVTIADTLYTITADSIGAATDAIEITFDGTGGRAVLTVLSYGG